MLGRREIEDVALVLSLGLDQAPGTNRVRLTVQIAVPRALGSGNPSAGSSDPNTPPAVVESVEAGTITEALRELETFINRRVTFMHLKSIVFGRELAEAGRRSRPSTSKTSPGAPPSGQCAPPASTSTAY